MRAFSAARAYALALGSGDRGASLDNACILGRGREDPGTTSLDGGRKHGHVATTLSLELDPEIDGPCVRLEIGRYREPA